MNETRTDGLGRRYRLHRISPDSDKMIWLPDSSTSGTSHPNSATNRDTLPIDHKVTVASASETAASGAAVPCLTNDVTTEQDWLSANDPKPMLALVHASDRKLRLFACACVAQVIDCPAHIFVDGDFQAYDSLRAGYRFADGLATAKEVPNCDDWYDWDQALRRMGSYAYVSQSPYMLGNKDAKIGAQEASEMSAFEAGRKSVQILSSESSEGWKSLRATEAKEKTSQAALLRDIVGNPFRLTPTIDPAWLSLPDGMVSAIAQTIYDDHAFTLVGSLAKALEDSGCTNQDILNHCRTEGPHVRGCWVVDLVLGKT